MSVFDVSVILNAHNEIEFIAKTICSLKNSIKYAMDRGVKIELICVLDDSPNKLKEIVKYCVRDCNFQVKLVEVNYRSLGCSRNAGVRNSNGEYVYTADGDDLVSRNSIFGMYNEAREFEKNQGESVAVYSQYVFIFGEENFIYRMFDYDLYSCADYAYWNPFNSKILIKKEVLLNRPYRDLGKGTGFAFEDWDLNASLRYLKIKQIVAKDVILYYRQHSSSIMHSSDYVRIIPDNPLFEPKQFVRERESEKGRILSNKKRREIINSRVPMYDLELINDVKASNTIEPEIKPNTLRSTISTLSSIASDHWGFKLEDIFRCSGCAHYGNVVLLDVGNSEFFVKEIENQKNDNFILVVLFGDISNITGKTKEKILRLDNLVLVPFENMFGYMIEPNREQLIARFLMSIHTKNCRLFIDTDNEFLEKLKHKYKRTLENYYTIYSSWESFKIISNTVSAKPDEEMVVSFYQKYVKVCDDNIRGMALCFPKQLLRDRTWNRVLADKLRNIPIIFKIAKRVYYNKFVYNVINWLLK